MSIENITSWDFECTTVQVDRDAATAGFGSVAFNNAVTADRIAAKTFFASPLSNTVTGSYQISLYYTETEISAWETETGNPRSEIEIIKVSNNPISAVNAGNYGTFTVENAPTSVVTFGDGVILTAGFTSGFSGFGVGILGAPTVLPVEYLDFNAEKQEERNLVKWETATEINASHFILMKSTDGINFEDIERVEAAGNSTEVRFYSVLDNNPSATTYYQLNQVDFDGTEDKSEIIALSRTTNSEMRLSPNPFRNSINVDFKNDVAYAIKLVDVNGKVVFYKNNITQQHITINTSDLSRGVYQLVIIANETHVSKVIKL